MEIFYYFRCLSLLAADKSQYKMKLSIPATPSRKAFKEKPVGKANTKQKCFAALKAFMH